jgi:hypothetical protein
MAKSYQRFSKLTISSVIFLVTIIMLIALSKGHRIIEILTKETSKAPEILESTTRFMKFSVSSSVAVKNEPTTPAKVLQKIRPRFITGPLRINTANPRYFSDSSGKAVYLTGAHTWSNFQDSGTTNPPPKFDFDTYLNFLEKNNHNFFRLWTWEVTGPWVQTTVKNYWFEPMPYQRTGPGKALDGGRKFDLTRFNQAYFDRLRQRVKEAADRGIYVSIMLFNGWSVDSQKGKHHSSNPWETHPFNKTNNINGIDGDPKSFNSGGKIHTLALPTITAIQEAYIRKVIDTVNDLDNVLYEISNESNTDSSAWQYHMISYIKNYERKKPKQHPVGMTVEYPNGDNSKLFNSPADWISPANKREINYSPTSDGIKVILADTDHLCGVCGEYQWVWKSFTRGENPLFMDPYDNGFVRNSTLATHFLPPDSVSDSLNYKRWLDLRRNLGYTLTYANRMNLVAMRPQNNLASTGYCLANPNSDEAEYLIYSPTGNKFEVDLSQTLGELSVEWFNPKDGLVIDGITTTGGGVRSFIPPFKGDAVLYIHSK